MNKKQIIIFTVLVIASMIIPIVLKAITDNLEFVIIIPCVVTCSLFLIYNRYSIAYLKTKKTLELATSSKDKALLKNKLEKEKSIKKYFFIMFLAFILISLFMGLVVYNTL